MSAYGSKALGRVISSYNVQLFNIHRWRRLTRRKGNPASHTFGATQVGLPLKNGVIGRLSAVIGMSGLLFAICCRQ